MSQYNENDNDYLNDQGESDDGLNTMAVLSTLGGGGDETLPEGEPMGLDPDAGKAKMSGSTLAVGVVVVLGALTLVGMKLTLGALGTGSAPIEAIAEIDNFIQQQAAAQQAGTEGPIKTPDAESRKVLEELKQDPTDEQIPAEEVNENPFDISDVVERRIVEDDKEDDTPAPDAREQATAQAQAEASRLKVDAISGPIVFINGKDYRVGDKIADGRFELVSIDSSGLTCIIRTTDEYQIALRLRYR